MAEKNQRHLGFRVNLAMHNKMKYIAYKHGQTVSGRVAFLMRRDIEQYEKKYGEITNEQIAELKDME